MSDAAQNERVLQIIPKILAEPWGTTETKLRDIGILCEAVVREDRERFN